MASRFRPAFSYLKRCFVNKGLFADVTHIVILSGFAVAQPLFDLLAQNPTFFVAQGSDPDEILLLAGYLTLIFPFQVFVPLELLAAFFGGTVRRAMHLVLVALLGGLIVLPALKGLDGLDGAILMLLAGSIGVIFTVAYARMRPVRLFVWVLSLSVLLFPFMFLANGEIKRLVFAQRPPSRAPVLVAGNPVPVVMIIFDGLSQRALQDESGNIDRELFPNFAALADGSHWFRQTTTVAPSTRKAVPAILTGKYANAKKRSPSLSYHPNNLFTILSRSYNFTVHESVTGLCPQSACTFSEITLFHKVARVFHMLSDIGVVWLHVVLPEDYSTSFPSISQGWTRFVRVGDKKKNRQGASGEKVGKTNKILPRASAKAILEELPRRMVPSEKPHLYFAHVLLPHLPYRYLPSGKKYRKNLPLSGWISKKELWVRDEWPVWQGLQRYLLQVAATDKLVGTILTKLKTTGLYDRSLIVFTSDHGTAFDPGGSRRDPTAENLADILNVPLFIKVPGQKKGVISDYPAETTDILPTIVDVLKLKVPFRMDGRSLLAKPERRRKYRVLFMNPRRTRGLGNYFNRRAGRFHLPLELPRDGDIVEKKSLLFRGAGHPNRLFAMGPHRDLAGLSPSLFSPDPAAGFSYTLDSADHFANLVKDPEFAASPITGSLHLPRDNANPVHLAVAVNGIIQAVGVALNTGSAAEARFALFVPEEAFRSGANQIQLFAISAAPEGKVSLTPGTPAK